MLDPQKDNKGHFKVSLLPKTAKQKIDESNQRRSDENQRKADIAKAKGARDKAKDEADKDKADRFGWNKRSTPSKPRQREISFGEALAQAKSAAYNHSSISDIESKTAKVMSMIGNANNLKDARDMSQNQGQVNSTSANVTNNSQNVTNISTDFLSGLRRDYQQMPSWRGNIA